MSQIQWLLLPLFIHLVLLNYVAIKQLRTRIASATSGETKLKDIALNNQNWPELPRKFGNNFSNQFEIPTLWYALTALLIVTGKVDIIFIVLSWAFVATRIVHTAIHTGSNAVRKRMRAFAAGFTILMIMWVWFAICLYFIG